MGNAMEEMEEYVRGRIFVLTDNLNTGAAKARLALLRQGIGKKPGELPELWGAFLQTLPQELMSRGNEPSYAEWAIYTALTLLALHQQGHSEPMNAQGREHSLGCAARRLVHGEEGEERIRLKLSLAARADDMVEVAYRLKTLIRLLSAEGIPLNYVDLAGDLFLFQSESHADRIRLKWGQDFYRSIKANENGKDEEDEEK